MTGGLGLSPAPPQEFTVTPELVREHELLPEEYERIVELLGREPNFTELGVFSVMWSEHCGYKNSRRLLRRLPTRGVQVLQGPGENAGVVDVGHGYAVAMKIESHNHPSAVEPYQGAATGVGGILRDVFTMGARPIASLNSLRFGPIEPGAPGAARNRYLFEGVVRGIGDYGNSVGIPTVGGETFFEPAYAGNPLVNAFSLGLLKREDLVRARAKGAGNPVFAVGASTGRDGIHGCSLLASTELDERSLANRPTVQVGDPFTEKLLLEATLEVVASGAAVGIQDMGAAGLTSSSAEMAARAGSGIEIDVGKLHLREPGMTPYEILLSESQERMLIVALRERADEIVKIFEKWDLPCSEIGRVTDDGLWRVLLDGETVCEIPVAALVEEVPAYEREARAPAYLSDLRAAGPPPGPRPPHAEALVRLLSSPNVASKEWIYRQYDHTVRTNTVAGPGGDAAVLRLVGTPGGIALSVDCNGRHVYLNPRRGAALAVAEAARNLVCVGARPAAVTDCLNFGNPYNPEVYYQFSEAVEGIREACLALGTPVVSGNVSFYNESPAGPVYPTPTIAMLGIVEDIERVIGSCFIGEGDAILLLGPDARDTDASEYEKVLFGAVRGDAPALDLDFERSLHELALGLIRDGLLRSAHDCSEGGLAVALAESAFAEGEPFGVEAQSARPQSGEGTPDTAWLYGEAPSRIVVSCQPAHAPAVVERAAAAEIPCRVLGTVGPRGGRFRIGGLIDVRVAHLHKAWSEALPSIMDASPELRDPEPRVAGADPGGSINDPSPGIPTGGAT
jgi:phosphoribosylformylglycinamidine synthase II